MNTTTELQRPVEAGHDVLITPTASARKELPPERYQITRGAVINQVAYHVACLNALLRSAERANVGTRMRILNDAEKELQNAEKSIYELESLASDEDVDYVLAYLQRVHHWEPRDIRPKKMERTPRQVRYAHTLPTSKLPIPQGSLTWEGVKKMVRATKRMGGLSLKGTPNEHFIFRHPGMSTGGGVVLTKSDGEASWRRILEGDGLLPKSTTLTECQQTRVDLFAKMNEWKHAACPQGVSWVVFDKQQDDRLCEATQILQWMEKSCGLGIAKANNREVLEEYGVCLVQPWLSEAEQRSQEPKGAVIATNQTIGRKLKKKLGLQAGDVLPDGTMVVDPTNAILELHDQANGAPVKAAPLKVEAVPPGKTIEQLLPAAKWVPPVSAANLTELAKPFGADRRAREVVKKRFTSLHGKLCKMDAEERAAFLQFINARFQ